MSEPFDPNHKKRDRAIRKVLAEIAGNRTPIRQVDDIGLVTATASAPVFFPTEG